MILSVSFTGNNIPIMLAALSELRLSLQIPIYKRILPSYSWLGIHWEEMVCSTECWGRARAWATPL